MDSSLPTEHRAKDPYFTLATLNCQRLPCFDLARAFRQAVVEIVRMLRCSAELIGKKNARFASSKTGVSGILALFVQSGPLQGIK